jgi:hypothetical protein
MDHFKFRVDLIQALIIEHGSETERTVQGGHSSDKMCRDCSKDIFPQEYHLQRKRPGQANKKVCGVLQTQEKEGDSVLVP